MKVEKTMKKPILIIAGGMVAVSLIWLVDKTFLAKESQPKTADKQQESAVEGQSSPTEQRTTDNPTSKPPVYDLSDKAHWYDPETTIGFRGSYQTLAKWLEPFKPNAEEFQIIAQYETARKKLKESMSEDEYYSVEGRKRLIDEILKLNKQLQQQLGKERTQFYAEVRELGTGYYDTWKVLTVNGISEERVAEFRELANEFNQQMHGRLLYRAERDAARYVAEDFLRVSLRERKQIAQAFLDRIEKEFGKQVLDDVLSLRGETFFMDQLDRGDLSRSISLLYDPKQQERLNSLYNVDYNLHSDDNSADKEWEEADRLANREKELIKEWAKKYGAQQGVPRELPIGWIP